MKNVKKLIMTVALGVTLSNVITCGEIVSASEYMFAGDEFMFAGDEFGWNQTNKVKKDEFWASEEVGYRLNVEDAAGMNRFYSLSKTTNSGEEWTKINEDPFNSRLGVAEGISFINEDLGFISLSRSAGTYGELYRTEDGGKSFERIALPDSCGELGYNPFVIAEAPYEEDGCLYVLVGQGEMGDYNGGRCKALFKSQDNGFTWSFEEIVYPEMEA